MDKKELKKASIISLVFIIVGIIFIALYVTSVIQYNNSIKDKEECIATVTEIRIKSASKYGSIDRVYVSYKVNNEEYNRELGTDTVISYSFISSLNGLEVGDKVKIYYNPQNPMEIATEGTLTQGLFIAILGLLIAALGVYLLIVVIKRSKE